MAGYFVLGTLAAFGALCALWALLGWLLPGGRGCAVVFFGEPEALTRFQWLKSLGLLHCPVLVVTDGAEAGLPGTENCTGEELLPRLEEERNRFYGTGTGDPAGRGQRRGISEL